MAIKQKVLNTSTLFEELKFSRDAALEKYQGQEVKVTGRVKAIVRSSYIVLDDKVRCTFDAPFFPTNVTDDQKILITGFVTGFDVHVVMEHCAVL